MDCTLDNPVARMIKDEFGDVASGGSEVPGILRGMGRKS